MSIENYPGDFKTDLLETIEHLNTLHEFKYKTIGWLLDTNWQQFLQKDTYGRKFVPKLLSGKDQLVYDILKSKYKVEFKPVEVIAEGKSHEGKQWGTNWSNGKTAGGHYAECFYETVSENPKVNDSLVFRVLSLDPADHFIKQKLKGNQVYVLCHESEDPNRVFREVSAQEEARKETDLLYGFKVSKEKKVLDIRGDVRFLNDPFHITLGEEYDNELKPYGKRDHSGHRFIK